MIWISKHLRSIWNTHLSQIEQWWALSGFLRWHLLHIFGTYIGQLPYFPQLSRIIIHRGARIGGNAHTVIEHDVELAPEKGQQDEQGGDDVAVGDVELHQQKEEGVVHQRQVDHAEHEDQEQWEGEAQRIVGPQKWAHL